MAEDRRKAIESLLRNNSTPITGSELAKQFNVSRQVIVQDIALMRAAGMDVAAASNGYYLADFVSWNNNIRTIVCNHKGYDSIEEELRIIIDMGGKILNVIINHPIYGDIVCPLNISSRHELTQFIDKVKNSNAAPLASLTDGEHLHTIEVPSEDVFRIIQERLIEKGYLVNN